MEGLMAKKGWLTLLLEQRLRDGLPIAADPIRYLYAPRAMKDRPIRRRYSLRIHDFAKKHALILILGPRGGLWSAVYVRDPTAHGESIYLRHLGMTHGKGYRIAYDTETAHRRGQHNQWTMWRIRHYRGQPYLCLKPRERRWYDPPFGYLVS